MGVCGESGSADGVDLANTTRLRYTLPNTSATTMALVSYSDSETSDVDDAPAPKSIPKSKPSRTDSKTSTSGFRTTETRKIKIDLPLPQAETQDVGSERPAKRARVDGGGFNSFLPAPKRTAEASKSGLGRGVSLKTSSEAAFSRELPVVAPGINDADPDVGDEDIAPMNTAGPETKVSTDAGETKIIGRATKFRPLSVQAGKKRKIKKQETVLRSSRGSGTPEVAERVQDLSSNVEPKTDLQNGPPPSKPKRSLFSVPQVEESADNVEQSTSSGDEAITTPTKVDDARGQYSHPSQDPQPLSSTTGNVNQDITAGLNLTAAQKRQIFGRNGKASNINFAHFNMDAEYASNEVLRQSGETVEHRAVKSIAPGKHSLQQLVNNAKSQQENLEDKWAEGRRERGEGSSRYGWGR